LRPPLYRPDFLKSDAITIRNLYIRHGFLGATVAARADSGTSPNKVIVVFTVQESLQVRVRKLEFDSTGVIGRATMRRETKLRSAEPYDPVQLALDRASLAERYAEVGYFPSITTLVTRDSSWADIRYEIRVGPLYTVRNIKITGVVQVDTNVVRREIQFKPGDQFKRERVIKSTERLYGTTLFNSAEVSPVLADTVKGLVDIDAAVRERKPRYIQGGIGSGNVEVIRLSGEWGHRNLWGQGRALTTRASYGKGSFDKDPRFWNGHGEVSYIEPWVFGLRLRGTVTPLWDRTFTPLGADTYIEEGFQLNGSLVIDYPYSESQLSLTLQNSWPTVTRVRENPETSRRTRTACTSHACGAGRSPTPGRTRRQARSSRGSLSRYAVQLASTRSGGMSNYRTGRR
jgi:outer membrane protein assembly factor BamA